jgi:hypothetical protein
MVLATVTSTSLGRTAMGAMLSPNPKLSGVLHGRNLIALASVNSDSIKSRDRIGILSLP